LDFLHFVRQHARALAFGALHAFYSAPGQTFCVGLFVASFGATFGLDPAAVGGLYMLGTIASAVTLLFVGQWIDHVRLVHFSAAVIVGVAVACFVTAAAVGPVSLFLAFYLLRLTGQGLMIHVEATATARAFDTARGRALGITALGLPLAEMVMPPLVVAGIAALGWRSTYALIGVVALVVLLPLTQWLLRGIRRAPPPGGIGQGPWRGLVAGLLLLGRSRFVWAALPSLAVPPFFGTAVFFHVTTIAAFKGWPLGLVGASFPASAGAHIVGLFASGYIIDRVSARKLFVFQSVPMVFALATLAFVGAEWALPVAFGLMGFGFGLSRPVVTAVWAELFGIAVLGTVRSAIAMYLVFASATAPFVFGALYEAGVSVEAILGGFAAACLLCILPSFYAEWRGFD
jgi:MFS family permease